jgi:hypothetical protein
MEAKNLHPLTRPTKGIAEANSLGQLTTFSSDDISQLAGGHLSHDQVATQVRMLLRTDFDHEAVCVMGRDRIKWLAHRVAVLEHEALSAGGRLSQALTDVMAERRRQIEQEGWTPDHDDEHLEGSLALAGGCYAANAATWLAMKADGLKHLIAEGRYAEMSRTLLRWPWRKEWWKPTNPRRDLIKAGALILSEIERLDRQQEQLQG